MTDDELLTPRPALPNEALRSDLQGRTSAILRRGFWFRRLGRVATFASCFVAGLTIAWAWPLPQSRIEVEFTRVEVPVPASVEASPPTPMSPVELERSASEMVERAEAARRYREAGHRYFRDWADYSAALRCYRQFLDAADPADLAVASDDTTLLVSLKNARGLEKNP